MIVAIVMAALLAAFGRYLELLAGGVDAVHGGAVRVTSRVLRGKVLRRCGMDLVLGRPDHAIPGQSQPMVVIGDQSTHGIVPCRWQSEMAVTVGAAVVWAKADGTRSSARALVRRNIIVESNGDEAT